MELTQQQWDAAHADAEILEQKISALVEEFEQKHKPIQTNILTRYRKIDHKYSVSKGGAAQVKLSKIIGDDIFTASYALLSEPTTRIEFLEP